MKKLLKKYNNLSVMSRASLWFFFCNLMMKGISVITVPLFTRLLTTEEYGIYSLYLSWFNILTIFTSLYLYYGAFNNVLNRVTKSEERDKYVSSMQGLTTFLVIILSLIYLLGRSFWSDLLGLSETALCLMLLQLWVEPCAQFYLARQRFEFKYKHAVVITIIKSLLNPLLGLFLVLNTSGDKALVRILSVVVTEVLVAGCLMIYQFIRGKTFYDETNWKYALSFNIPMLPHYLSMVMLSQADRVMIERYAGVGKVAIYSVAYSIGMLVQIFTNAVNSSLTPWTYEKLNQKNYKAIRESTNILLWVLAGAICGLLLFVPEVVVILAPKKYYEAIYVVPPVACSVFFIFLYNIFAIPQMYFERQKFMSLTSTATAVLNVILNYIFIKMFGYIAAGYTTVACYMFYSIGHYIINQKVCKDRLEGNELYDQKSILLISTFVLFCSVVFNFLYGSTAIRYVLLVMVGVVAVIFRKKIMSVMSLVKKS